MNKKQFTERDICTKYITPALERAGWDIVTQIREEFPLTHRDPEELMEEYQEIVRKLETAQADLKRELMQALGGN